MRIASHFNRIRHGTAPAHLDTLRWTAPQTGVYGVGIVSAADEAEARDAISRDPAAAILSYQIHPMRAVLPD